MFLTVPWHWVFCIYSITVAATVSLILFAFYPFYNKAKIAAWEERNCGRGLGYSQVGLYF